MKNFPALIIKTCIFIASIGSISFAVIRSGIIAYDNGFPEFLSPLISSDISTDKKNRPPDTIAQVIAESDNMDPSVESGSLDNPDIPENDISDRDERTDIYNTDDVNIEAYGSFNLNIMYGKSMFADEKYKRSDDDTPVSNVIEDGLLFDRNLKLHMEGSLGQRLKVYIDHDSEQEDNKYSVKYTAVEDDEVIREINAGEIDIKFDGSKYAVYDDTSSKGLGLDLTLKKNKFKVKAFGSIIKGDTEIETFYGNTSPDNLRLSDYQYVKNTYFQLEPFKRYDNLSALPVPGDDPYNTLITFTSDPADPENYAPFPVNVSPSGFELYMDDQNPYNNLNTISLSYDGGYYDKLASGADYTVNFTTGLIRILKPVPKNARIFALYKLAAGSNTTDPGAVINSPEFSGRIFVFIKYNYSINEDINNNFLPDPGEDKNNDGRMNLDIYEVRSFYRVRENLSKDNFRMRIYRGSRLVTGSDQEILGNYSIDYSGGITGFFLREPFRQLYSIFGDDAKADAIYSENQPAGIFNSSLYNLSFDFYREARNFQLKHAGVIQGTERVMVNGRVLSPSLYSVDYDSGFLKFTDPDYPVIGPDTVIEIKYDYLPYGPVSGMAAGVRTDYALSRHLNIGGTVLFTREGFSETVPAAGTEPGQTLLLETDASLVLTSGIFKNALKAATGIDSDVPLEFRAYAEYAGSIRNANTFGKALIDDMESSSETTSLSVSEKDWILSSMPNFNNTVISQSDRGLLLYRYYRDPGNPAGLQGLGFNAAAVPYSRKPGPYNVAAGHVPDSILETSSQKSLVFDFDFSTGGYVCAATGLYAAGAGISERSSAVDLSGLIYVEIWYRSGGGSGEAELYLDIGAIDEDSDSDGILDTEDLNNNGMLDFSTSAAGSEDKGYEFNPAGHQATLIGSGPGLNSYTTGDGVLNSEDINRNGMLDGNENIIRFPGSATAGFNNASPLIIDMNDTSWKKARIYLDKSSSDYQLNSNYYEDMLKRVESVRLFLRNNNATTGTVYIDSIKFVSDIWGNMMLDDAAADSPDEFSLTLVDTYNDDEYRANSYMIADRDNYESLYGDRSDDEFASEKETAIQINYDLALRQKASLTRRFKTGINISVYKTLNLWFNFREFTSGDSIGVIIGSSDSDYFEYRFPMANQNIWTEEKLKLKGDSGGNIDKFAVAGDPDLKRISFIRIDVYGQSAGRFWMNDIILSEAGSLTDKACWYEGEISVTKPLFYTDNGTPVFSDINLKYIYKGYGLDFSTLGKPVDGIEESCHEVFSSVMLIPNWETKIDFIAEDSASDSTGNLPEDMRGASEKRSIVFETNYISANYFPSIKVLYKQDALRNQKEENFSDNIVIMTRRNKYAPSIIIEDRMENFLSGTLTNRLKLDCLFRDERIGETGLNSTEEDEKEKRQKGYLDYAADYRNSVFFLKPSLKTGSHEIVDAEGKTYSANEIRNDFDSSFHFPFVYNKELKFVEREKGAAFRTGIAGNYFISPDVSVEYTYTESNFRDYSENEKSVSGGFNRARNSTGSVSNSFSIPVSLNRFSYLDFIKSLNLSFSRSILLNERDVPYEGERVLSFKEHYGIRRPFNGLSNPCFNLFTFTPWHFFTGRGNFARGRDFLYYTFNEGITNDRNSPLNNYNNDIRLNESISLNSILDMGLLTITGNTGISQLAERYSLFGIPQEIITLDFAINLNLDLMRVFGFGFFRPNSPGIPYHSVFLNIGYSLTRNMLITSNILETWHSPDISLIFKRDRKSLGIKAGLDYRNRKNREYISLDDSARDPKDDIYVFNMNSAGSFLETDNGYRFSVFFETDIQWLYGVFSRLYALYAYPVFNMEYSLLLNRYDYRQSISPEPYDLHLITAKLNLDLHRNIQGGLTARWAEEKYMSRETGSVNRGIRSYEFGMNFALIF